MFLAAWGMGWIGKVSCGCDRSMRWLVVGAKVPSMAFSAAPSRWAKNAKHVESESVRAQKMKCWLGKE